MHSNRARAEVDLGSRLLRRRQVEEKTGLSRATIYRFMSQGRFPKPAKGGDYLNLWSEIEIEAWIAERLAARAGA